MDNLREEIAKSEHEQWVRWAKALLPVLKLLTKHHLPYGDWREEGNCACDTCNRIKRWEKLFVPYEELTEEMKELDRKEADQIINLLADHGYGKMVEGEERVSFTSGEFGGRCVYREKIFQPIERIK